jgi:glycosyltransferase involved in cell wall biosynthesis
MAKNIEKRFFLSADHIVLLTNAASKIISEFSYLNGKHPPMSIIPTCVDLSHFKKNFNNGTKKEFIVGYVGSVGTWYLFDEVLRSFKMLLTIKPNATMLVVNRKENSYINERMTALSVDKSKVKVISAEYADMPDLLSKISLGIFFYKPSYSRNACSPTKLGEFLAMGIPCLSNVGVGDILKILEGDEVGVVIENFSNDSMKDGLNKVLNLCEAKDIERRCRNISEKYYSLSDGAKVYDDIYKSLENI